MTNIGIILAGGSGKRMGGVGEKPKQFQLLAGREVIDYSISLFDASPYIQRIGVVVGREWVNETKRIIEKSSYHTAIDLIEGGVERHHSCRNALTYYLETLAEPANLLFHDAARPLLSDDLLSRVCKALQNHVAVTPILPCTDTIWSIEPTDQQLKLPLNRRELGNAQTPQGFRIELLRDAYQWYEQQEEGLPIPTDSCTLIHHAFPDVWIAYVDGCAENIKITTKVDLAIANNIVKEGLSN